MQNIIVIVEGSLPLDMKKCWGYNNLNPNNVKIHSTEKDPLSTKSPLNNWINIKKIKSRKCGEC